MKITRLIFLIALIIVIAWFIGFILKIAAWLIGSLFYLAAIIVIVGLIMTFLEGKKKH